MDQGPEVSRNGIRYWVDRGASFSGHERNRFFMQSEGQDGISYADRSLVSGADAVGDGRAFAKLDWDKDGDIDMVLTNANAPRVQLFENQVGSGDGGALWVDLHGSAKQGALRGSNRDAIGARVVVRTQSGDRHAEKRAGEGFAAQNSGWLHFGLGALDSAEGLSVYWPSGKQSDVEGPLQAGSRIRIYEDSSDSPTRSSLELIP